MYEIRKESAVLSQGQTPEEAISKLTGRHEKTELWFRGQFVAELEHTEEKIHTHWVGD
jgi:hypothetical protein